jgi:rare lipoprotein A
MLRRLLTATTLAGALLALRPVPVFANTATYYSDYYEGRQTASGEIFSQSGYTAASNAFAFGTQVRVTNLDNGRSVVVRINDRHGGGTGIDLSRAAAQAIGMISTGRAPVSIQVLN